MYKLFLCLRYLRKRIIAYFAVVGVALCVAMMLIVTSVMTGFLNKIETAARGLFGDIVMEPHGQWGIAHYDEWMVYLKANVPEVQAASPRIYSYGMLRLPGQNQYRVAVQITGIRFPDICETTAFEEGLFVQKGLANPSFDPPTELMIQAVQNEIDRIEIFTRRAEADAQGKILSPYDQFLLNRFYNAQILMGDGIANYRTAELNAHGTADLLAALNAFDNTGGNFATLSTITDKLEAELGVLREHRAALTSAYYLLTDAIAKQDAELLYRSQQAALDHPDVTYLFADAIAAYEASGNVADLEPVARQTETLLAELDLEQTQKRSLYNTLGRTVLEQDIDVLERRLEDLEDRTIEEMPHRVILGLGIEGLAWRTSQGDTVRVIGPGSKIILYVFPLGGDATSKMDPNIQKMTIVDDCSTDVSSIDSKSVYVPFEELQRLNNMGPVYGDDGRLVEPGRCSLVEIKVRTADGHPMSEAELRKIREKVATAWIEFKKLYPDASHEIVETQTWRERQRDIIRNIETQRILMIIMFGIISLVSVVLVFVIFYMIVVQKTWDIGVLKALGASSSGVAGIFLTYGAAIGLVGSLLGTIGGFYFVKYINPIQDWLDATFGFRVWSREQYMFERIPNDVDPRTVILIIIGATIAGIIGATVPAIRAARMQPVEALRYE